MRILSLLLVIVAAIPGRVSADPSAEDVLEAAGVDGGLVVHVGCGDGELTAALRRDKRYVIHGLDTSAENVKKARALIREKGVYGPVSVAQFDGEHLPYADGLVNLVVVSRVACRVSWEEIERVLAPRGVVTAPAGFAGLPDTRQPTTDPPGRHDGRVAHTKPVPPDVDEWSHFLHDASNDCTARDTRVGPPRRMIWRCRPLWSRSHEHSSSLVAMVTAGGRIYYIFDEGLTSVTDAPIPERWTLTARDAYNGVLLWKRRLPKWRDKAWTNRSLRGVPPSVQRLLVADGKRLFTPLTLSAAVSIIDGATGEILATCQGSEGAQELRCLDGVLLARRNKEGILAFGTETGEKLWNCKDNPAPNTMAAQDSRVYYQVGAGVACLDLKSGARQWTTAATPRQTPQKGKKGRKPAAVPIIVHGDTVLFNGSRGLAAVSAKTGKTLWEGKGRMGSQVFVANGKLWQHSGRQVSAIDLATGEAAGKVDASDVFTPGHHPRCYQAKASANYVITPNRGIEFVSLTGSPNSQHDWARGPCRYGIMPANGLLYAPPHPCFCYPGVKLTGFNALAGGESVACRVSGVPAPGRLEKGPAYGASPIRHSAIGNRHSSDWPTYRHDVRRTGATGCRVSSNVSSVWTAALTAPLTPPVCVGERLYVAARDEHTLYALNIADGSQAWTFTTDGRIDSPPTVHGGLILLGCTDGRLYCLRASDGVLIWRLCLAPVERLIVSESQLESAWPVHGSVLVEDGVAYATAGRSTYLDGGIRVVAVDIATGQVKHETTLETWTHTRDDAVDKPFVAGYHMEGSHSDILVSEGGYLYMGQYKLDKQLNTLETPYILPGKDDSKPKALDLAGQPFADASVPKTEGLEVHQRKWLENAAKPLVAQLREKHGGFNLGHRAMGRHVFSTSGFLDDSWFNRTYWMYAESWPGFYIANVAAKTGQLLAVGPERTYAIQAYPRRNMQSPLFTPGAKGYLLVADANDNEPFLEDRTRETTKGWGFTRKAPPVWHDWVSIRIRAMVLAGETLFVAGAPDTLDTDDPMASFDGRKGAVLRAVAAADGGSLSEQKLPAPPVFDGLIATANRLFICTTDGKVHCFGAAE